MTWYRPSTKGEKSPVRFQVSGGRAFDSLSSHSFILLSRVFVCIQIFTVRRQGTWCKQMWDAYSYYNSKSNPRVSSPASLYMVRCAELGPYMAYTVIWLQASI